MRCLTRTSHPLGNSRSLSWQVDRKWQLFQVPGWNLQQDLPTIPSPCIDDIDGLVKPEMAWEARIAWLGMTKQQDDSGWCWGAQRQPEPYQALLPTWCFMRSVQNSRIIRWVIWVICSLGQLVFVSWFHPIVVSLTASMSLCPSCCLVLLAKLSWSWSVSMSAVFQNFCVEVSAMQRWMWRVSAQRGGGKCCLALRGPPPHPCQKRSWLVTDLATFAEMSTHVRPPSASYDIDKLMINVILSLATTVTTSPQTEETKMSWKQCSSKSLLTPALHDVYKK